MSQELLRAALVQDQWEWDWTSLGLGQKLVTAKVVAKSKGIWAGAQLCLDAESVARSLGSKLEIKSKVDDGAEVSEGQEVARFKGEPRFVLGMERPFLNLAQYASGIATETRRFVREVEKTKVRPAPRVTPTRKTLPLYRGLALHAVRLGGGMPHRISLGGGVLIKENHIAIAGSIQAAVDAAKKNAPHLLKIEVEVRNLKECEAAVRAGADVVMLDNFKPKDVKAALGLFQGRTKPLIEVSGGVTLETIASYCISGVDVISVGKLTHSVSALDLSLLVE